MLLLVHYYHICFLKISPPWNVFDLSLYPEQIMQKQAYHFVGLRNEDKKLPVVCIIITGNYSPVQIFLLSLFMTLGFLSVVSRKHCTKVLSIHFFSLCFFYLENFSPNECFKILVSLQTGDNRDCKLNICKI